MRRTHGEGQPQVDIRPGTAALIPVENGCADAIICAQVRSLFANQADLGVSLVCQWGCPKGIRKGVEIGRFIRFNLELLRHFHVTAISSQHICLAQVVRMGLIRVGRKLDARE